MLKSAFLCILVLSLTLWADETNRESIQAEMQGIIQSLDNGSRAQSLQNDDYIVALFQQVLGKNPTMY